MLKFNKDTHEYSLDGKKLISVTQLMQKYGLAPNYDGVSPEILKRKAERGTLIHQEIEEYIKKREIGISDEVEEFVYYVNNNNVNVVESEYQVWNDVVAGTIDLILQSNNSKVIADIKTTYSIHKESISWQLSIYLYLYLNLIDKMDEYNDYVGQVYHFNKDGKLSVINIPIKNVVDVERLIDCERKGESFDLVNHIGLDLEKIIEVEKIIKYYDEKKKEFEKEENELKNALIKAMEENGITSYENESIKLTYVSSVIRETIDTNRLKEERPELVKDYIKLSEVKPSVRIKIKENKNE